MYKAKAEYFEALAENKQAKIDELMLEFCPEEVSDEQIKKFEDSIRKVNTQSNQCDGCMSRLATVDGLHVDSSCKPVMACTKALYT